MLRRTLLMALLCGIAATGARAHSYVLGAVEIGHPWTRPTDARLGAAYCVLAIKGDAADTLSSAETPIAQRVELRSAAGEAVHGLEIAPGRPVVLRPGKAYLALVGLKQPLKLGESFPLTLRFDVAGEITVTVMVQNVPGE
jgi:periplasmic copper chaperone A